MSAAVAHSSAKLDQQIEWLGLCFSVPRDWEVVRHGLSPKQGSLVLVDRRTQRVTLSWTECSSRPDLDRLLSDYRSKQEQEAGNSTFRPFRSGAYRGFSHEGAKGERVTRAVRYHAPHSRLVEVLFIEPEGKEDRPLLLALLDSLRLTAPPEQARRLCAFGLDVTAPDGFVFTRAEVKPLDVSLYCSQREGAATACVRRLGMVSSWRRSGLGRLVRQHWPKVRFGSEQEDASGQLTLTGYEPGPVLWRWLGRLRRQQTVAWEARAEDAVYELTTHSFDKRPVAPAAFVVRASKEASRCC